MLCGCTHTNTHTHMPACVSSQVSQCAQFRASCHHLCKTRYNETNERVYKRRAAANSLAAAGACCCVFVCECVSMYGIAQQEQTQGLCGHTHTNIYACATVLVVLCCMLITGWQHATRAEQTRGICGPTHTNICSSVLVLYVCLSQGGSTQQEQSKHGAFVDVQGVACAEGKRKTSKAIVSCDRMLCVWISVPVRWSVKLHSDPVCQ